MRAAVQGTSFSARVYPCPTQETNRPHLSFIVMFHYMSIASTFMVRGNPYLLLFLLRSAERTDRRSRRLPPSR